MMEDKPVEYETRTTQWTVGVKGERLYNELGYTIEIMDDGELAEYLEVSTHNGHGDLRIDKQCWPTLREAIDKMLKECRDDA